MVKNTFLLVIRLVADGVAPVRKQQSSIFHNNLGKGNFCLCRQSSRKSPKSVFKVFVQVFVDDLLQVFLGVRPAFDVCEYILDSTVLDLMELQSRDRLLVQIHRWREQQRSGEVAKNHEA